jgi:RNA polymerase sigma-70 factor (ECF subfamily)
MHLFGINKEQQIIEMFSHGDSRAMDLLYAEYSGLLTGICARYIPNEEDRHDILQECFIKIFMKVSTFRYQGKGSLQAWMSRIVINESLSYLRHQKAMLISDEKEEIPDIPEEQPDTDNLTENQILELIARLPDGYRTVFNLFAIEGKSHKEIARILHIKPDTSASQYFRAKNMLARMIKDLKKKENKL